MHAKGQAERGLVARVALGVGAPPDKRVEVGGSW